MHFLTDYYSCSYQLSQLQRDAINAKIPLYTLLVGKSSTSLSGWDKGGVCSLVSGGR